jgi:RNA polymerase sigma factor for flagellar operon FliA
MVAQGCRKSSEGRVDVERFLPLVEQIVTRIAMSLPRHVDRGELVRAGQLGLVEAGGHFDESRGVPFDRFASRRIEGAILDALRSSDWAPRSLRARARAAEATSAVLAQELRRTPTSAEVAAALGVPEADMMRLPGEVHRSVVLTLDQRVTGVDGDDATLGDLVPDRTAVEPDEELENREMHSYLHDAVDLLPARHRFVIESYFLKSVSSEEIAASLGVTESRVSQMRTEALAMLREGLEAQYITTPETPAPIPAGRAARRSAAFAAAIAARSTVRSRLEAAEIRTLSA